MIKLAISGCQGRMGSSIYRLAKEDSEFTVTTLLEDIKHPQLQEKMDDLAISTDNAFVKGNDVLIEFTSPHGTMANLKACIEHKVKMVIGTTGLSQEQIRQVQEASEKFPIVFASNMAVGVNLLFKLTQLTAEKITQPHTIHISEVHHIHKKDAPSGTAITLAQIVEKVSGQRVKNIESIREGEIIGDHSITLESEEDAITISHHAKSRDVFAKGALVAAKFLVDEQKGLYNMQDVLGLT